MFLAHDRPADRSDHAKQQIEAGRDAETPLHQTQKHQHDRRGGYQDSTFAWGRVGLRTRPTLVVGLVAGTRPQNTKFPKNFKGPWRRGWDSNPRYAYTYNGFRDRHNRPLCHLSAAGRRLIDTTVQRCNAASSRLLSIPIDSSCRQVISRASRCTVGQSSVTMRHAEFCVSCFYLPRSGRNHDVRSHPHRRKTVSRQPE